MLNLFSNHPMDSELLPRMRTHTSVMAALDRAADAAATLMPQSANDDGNSDDGGDDDDDELKACQRDIQGAARLQRSLQDTDFGRLLAARGDISRVARHAAVEA